MRTHPLRPNLVLAFACLLALLFFIFGMVMPQVHFWGAFLLPILAVFLWGRRRDIYIVTALASVLVVITFWTNGVTIFDGLLVSHLLAFAILWAAAWLLAQRRQFVDREQELAGEVAARTAELRASERRYRLIAENAGDLIWTVDMDGCINYASPAAQRVRGVTGEEEQSASWFDRMPPETAARAAAALEADLAALRAGRPIDGTPRAAPAYRNDGTLMWSETVMSPLYDDDGKPMGLCGTTRDITARHEIEDALRRSEERFGKLFEATPMGIVLGRQSDLTILDANDAFIRLTGFTREELVGRTSVELGILSAEVRGGLVAAVKSAGRARGMELQICSKSGVPIDVVYSIEPIDIDGEACFLSTLVDITARKQLEEQLRASEGRYRLLAENSNDLIWAVDMNGELTYVSAAVERMRGVTSEEELSTPWSDRLPPEVEAQIGAAIEADLAALRMGQPIDAAPYTAPVYRKDGSLMWVETVVSALYEDGRPIGISCATRDITARHEAEAQLREANQRLQLATDAAGIGIWAWSFADNRLEWDERMCEMHAVTTAERQAGISYDLWRARIHPDDRALVASAQGDPSRAREQPSAVYRIVLPGGAVRYIQAIALVESDPAGQPYRIVGVNRDITDQVHYEQLLQDTNAELEDRVAARTAALEAALADLQRATQLKDEFMAMISHELRTPLTGVLAMSEMLEDQVAGPLNARQVAYVKGITQSGERLLAVISGILGYTHLLSGKVQLQAEVCNLAVLLATCAAGQQQRAVDRQLAVAVQVLPPDLTVTGDAAAIGEVLKRLLDNAVKFTPDGGQVGLVARLGAAPSTVDLVVWDTGCGIAADQLDHILKPFTQADARLARSHEGLGLGLAYVDQMVRLMGGVLTIASTPGVGSSFTITLPVRLAAA